MSKVLQHALQAHKKTMHYYMCNAESIAGQQMQKLTDKCYDATEQAMAWVEKQGGTDYLESPYGLAGGVSFVVFHDGMTPNPELWAEENDLGIKNLYKVNVPDDLDMRPYLKEDVKVGNDAVALAVERMRLPIVGVQELLAILKPKQTMRKGKDGKNVPAPIVLTKTPVFFGYKTNWYVAYPGELTSEDWHTILPATFNRLKSLASKE